MKFLKTKQGIYGKNSIDQSPELDAVLLEEKELEQKIEQAQQLLADIPKRNEQRQQPPVYEEQIMPPPGEVAERQRERKFNVRLTSNDLRNQKRYEVRSASLMIMLFIAAVALIAYAWKVAQSGL